MSRIAKIPIPVPGGVEVTIADRSVSAKGPKGERSLRLLPGIDVVRADGVLEIRISGTEGASGAKSDKKPDKNIVSMSGTARAM